MNFKITEKIEEKDRSEIFQGLLEYNLDRIEDRNPKELGIYLEDEQGRKQAGLIGETHGNWLMVKFLWVDESLRGRHIGSRILEEAEIEARKRGCKYAFLDTFSFQAPDFYKNTVIVKCLRWKNIHSRENGIILPKLFKMEADRNCFLPECVKWRQQFPAASTLNFYHVLYYSAEIPFILPAPLRPFSSPIQSPYPYRNTCIRPAGRRRSRSFRPLPGTHISGTAPDFSHR